MTEAGLSDAISHFRAHFYSELVYFLFQGQRLVYLQSQLDELRDIEVMKLRAADADVEVWFNRRSMFKNAAILDLCLTSFVLVMLAIGAAVLYNDSQVLVIAPIERMVHFVNLLAKNPLAAIDQADQGKHDERGQTFETKLLENTLMRLGGLIQVSLLLSSVVQLILYDTSLPSHSIPGYIIMAWTMNWRYLRPARPYFISLNYVVVLSVWFFLLP